MAESGKSKDTETVWYFEHDDASKQQGSVTETMDSKTIDTNFATNGDKIQGVKGKRQNDTSPKESEDIFDSMGSILQSFECSKNKQVTVISELSDTREKSQDLEEARKNGSFCDITLLIGPRRYPIKAHRIILASISNYFKTMFTSDFKEGTEAEIELPKMDVPVMESLIEFAYSGKTKVTDANVEQIVTAANFFGMSKVLHKCLEYIMVRINPRNAIEILQYADYISNNDLKHSAIKFIIKEFEVISSTNLDIMDMSTTLLMEIIGDRATSIHPNPIENEERLFQLGWNHLRFKPEDVLERFLPQLLQAVHLPRVSDEFLQDLERKVGDHETVKMLIQQAKHIKSTFSCFQNEPSNTKIQYWAMNRFRKSALLSIKCDGLRNASTGYWMGVPAILNGLPLSLVLGRQTYTEYGRPMDYLGIGIQCLEEVNSHSIPCKVYFNLDATKIAANRLECKTKCKYIFDAESMDNILWVPKFMRVSKVLLDHYNYESDSTLITAQIVLESDVIYP